MRLTEQQLAVRHHLEERRRLYARFPTPLKLVGIQGMLDAGVMYQALGAAEADAWEAWCAGQPGYDPFWSWREVAARRSRGEPIWEYPEGTTGPTSAAFARELEHVWAFCQETPSPLRLFMVQTQILAGIFGSYLTGEAADAWEDRLARLPGYDAASHWRALYREHRGEEWQPR